MPKSELIVKFKEQILNGLGEELTQIRQIRGVLDLAPLYPHSNHPLDVPFFVATVEESAKKEITAQISALPNVVYVQTIPIRELILGSKPKP